MNAVKKIRERIRRNLSAASYRKLRNAYRDLITVGSWSNLNKLAQINQCDKYGFHYYTPHYMEHFSSLRYKKINLLEIGVGGYDNPDDGGASLRMWKRYFPFGKIYSIDIHDKSALEERRVRIFQGSQVDGKFLDRVLSETGPLDIIIDDGSHENDHVIKSFKYLFPHLKKGGIYVIEDTQTAYWEEYGGDSQNLDNPNTSVNFFRNMIHGLNYKEFRVEDYEPDYYDKHITSMHFYHNLIFIYKGDNDEGTNRS